MTKPWATCSLPDLVHEMFLARAAVIAPLLPRLADAEAMEALLQRHPIVRGASGLVCTDTAESKIAWCSMLRDLLGASGEADLLRVYNVCRHCSRCGRVRVCDSAFVSRVRLHPSAASAGHELLAQLTALPVRGLASQLNVRRWRAMLRFCIPSPAPALHWHAIGIDIGLQQRRDVLRGGALLSVLVPRLLCLQGESGVRQPFHLAQRMASRFHFLGSKQDEAEGVFEEGQRLYGQQRFSEAAERWRRAALLQHAPSHAHLSHMLIKGRAGVAVDEERAFEFAAAGAALGCAHSKGVLGYCYVQGHGAAIDRATGLALVRESAAAGSCFGQFVVGRCFDLGCGGVAKDIAEAVRFYHLAAAQGHANAQNYLGSRFMKGQGVAQDSVEAARLFRLAAEQGHAVAQINLGFLLENGQGVAQDKAEAVRLYHLAAAQGVAAAQFRLGNMFECGRGVAKDRAEAIRWYRLAAEQGHADAQEQLDALLFRSRKRARRGA
jgi:TPR repeat protein